MGHALLDRLTRGRNREVTQAERDEVKDMADALSHVEATAEYLRAIPHVVSAEVSPRGSHAMTVAVELDRYSAKTWCQVVEQVDEVGRMYIAEASVDLEMTVRSSPEA